MSRYKRVMKLSRFLTIRLARRVSVVHIDHCCVIHEVSNPRARWAAGIIEMEHFHESDIDL